MGVCMYMRLDNEKQCPLWFTRSDSKALVWYLNEVESGPGSFPNTIGKLAQHFKLDIQPLLKTGGEDLSLEDFDDNEELFNRYRELNRFSWQDPQELIDCLNTFVNALNSDPNLFATLQVTDDYFLWGVFKQDLLDIIAMAQWAQENGAQRIQLEAA